MPVLDRSQSLAVLIDADNTSERYAHAIFEEVAKLGEANVRRIYGDFSGSRLAGWDKKIQALAILQHQQRNNTTGKNAADIALVIDAMDLMHKGKAGRLLPCQFGQRFHPGWRNACGRMDWWSMASESARPRKHSAVPATGSSMSRI